MIPFERSLSKLSENHKIVEIRSTEFKLWLLKDVPTRTGVYIPRALFSRADELKRQYTGAICGLGFDVDTDESIYSEHDMELTFDTLISQDDLKMVQINVYTLFGLEARL